ncbi:molybdopterin molybdotransferase MoeA [Microbacterium imperiale]|uniref:Molybdopterin molybdenumtransferase n=1 Tax=Microbacterium imperiale TaxID=33884 RepID=A0A9W6M405_9MICO|nr:gephyrin-like molybdotransferase Glp [Microbacterium imperiale]MBP2421808.1 molybdopterin molybdotransferase [Microbacterium imperiale]MDS0199091.1 molybdopterin molybdotransferase MoeA [Microbacterium imperiale]BFE39112.1 molybdopterin molybdotransferase MoeA [Microbacterium imperiale]GLJ81103.1 molybdopterin molybdenumtransferase MoeA [Microbacterium imperiale]
MSVSPGGGLRSVEEHLADILAAVHPLPTRTVDLADADGLTLRDPVRAHGGIPAFDNSAMDGFAVRFDDVSAASEAQPIELTVVADLPAGGSDDPPLGRGQAARIMTGAPVPTDADAIVPFEDTAGGLEDSLRVVRVLRAPARRGVFIRRAHDDLRPGDRVLEPGVLLGPLQLAAAAAADVPRVTVSQRPRVAIVSTGSELVEPGMPRAHGQIPESNGLLLQALVRAAGGSVVVRERVDDDGPGLRRVLERIAVGDDRADVLITSGGVSAGAYEVVKTELGDALRFSRVAMQPGKPQAFGVLPSGTMVFGLPGNPVSAAVSFEVFVRPALLALQGRTALQRPGLRLPAGAAWRTPPGRRQYLPAAIDRTDPARWTVGPATGGGSGSHLAGGLARAEAYAIVPAEVSEVSPGDLVDVLLLGG